MRVYGYQASLPSGRLWRIVTLTAAGAIGTLSQAEAQLYYWSDSEPAFSSQPQRTFWHRPPKPRRHQAKKIEAPEESGRPQGPLIIAISIEKQNLKIYDANGFFAETPISTGMSGYPTPLGVFSVIQKHKLHHSNIYSGAPMPYMQRITWSGVAIHAGVLPGYPRSEEHTSELQSQSNLVCRLLLEKKKKKIRIRHQHIRNLRYKPSNVTLN